MVDNVNKKCPLCELYTIEKCGSIGDFYSIKCRDCGEYIMSCEVFEKRQSYHECDKKAVFKRSAVMLERNLKGLGTGVKVHLTQGEQLFCFDTGEPISSYYPVMFRDKLERGFCNILRGLSRSPLVRFKVDDVGHDSRKLLFIEDSGVDEKLIIDFMIEEGWLRTTASGDSIRRYIATTKGLSFFDEKIKSSSLKNAFLAMWFGVKGNNVYRESVHEAVKSAGYHLQIVNVEDYNGFIMDKVVNLINDSAFVIADISAMPEKIKENGVDDGVRGGVYWEAGYAAGQKKQVILTCNDDEECKKRIHFDLQQYNQIRWRVVNGVVKVGTRDFVDVLTQRILATVGKGSR